MLNDEMIAIGQGVLLGANAERRRMQRLVEKKLSSWKEIQAMYQDGEGTEDALQRVAAETAVSVLETLRYEITEEI